MHSNSHNIDDVGSPYTTSILSGMPHSHIGFNRKVITYITQHITFTLKALEINIHDYNTYYQRITS